MVSLGLQGRSLAVPRMLPQTRTRVPHRSALPTHLGGTGLGTLVQIANCSSQNHELGHWQIRVLQEELARYSQVSPPLDRLKRSRAVGAEVAR